MVHCVKLMPRISEFGVLLFDRFVYCQNVMGITHAGEVEDIIIGRLAIVS